MYTNVGNKIKSLVTIVTTVGIILSCVLGIGTLGIGKFEGIIIGFLTAGIGSLVSWVTGLVLYGFGQLIENSDKIANMYKNDTEEFSRLKKKQDMTI